MTYYCLYKITNITNGKIYIGIHVTDNLDDGYMGSGSLIRQAIKKHGLSSFKKEYLMLCDSREQLLSMEAKIVNEEFVKSENTYNMCCGGSGGCPFNYNQLLQKNREKLFLAKSSYYKNPPLCKECSSIIEYGKRFSVFCNHSCSAKHNNKKRGDASSKKQKINKEAEYLVNPKTCKQCDCVIAYKKRKNVFCGRSCKAKFTNHFRYKEINIIAELV